MNTKAMIKALEMMIEALSEDTSVEKTASAEKATAPTTKGKTPKAKETKETSGIPDIKGMSYNDLKSLCKKLGVSATGARAEVEKNLLAYYENGEVSEETEEEVAPAKSSKATSKKSAPVEIEDDMPDDDESTEDEEEQSTHDLVVEATEDMTVEELASMLAEVGISGKGRRDALISKITKAVDDGLISLEGEDEDEDEETDEGTSDEDEGESEDEVEEMSPKRAKFRAKLVKDVESGKVSLKEINKYLTSISEDYSPDDYDDEDITTMYIDTKMSMVDDDGVEHETEDPYTINGENYCCGEQLEYNKKKKVYTCSECGAEYGEE